MSIKDAEGWDQLKQFVEDFNREQSPYLKRWATRMEAAGIKPFGTAAEYAAWALPAHVQQRKFPLKELDVYVSAKIRDAELSRPQVAAAPATSAKPKNSNNPSGRPRDFKQVGNDKRIAETMVTCRSTEETATRHKMSVAEVKLAIDRHRKREGRT